MNPHKKETHYVNYLEEKEYVGKEWHDTGIWVEVGGLGLIICTISISTGYHSNVGFRIVDENDQPLQPYRKKINTRVVAHFAMEPETHSLEDLTPVTFHMIGNCKYAKLQAYPDDGGRFRINAAPTVRPPTDAIWNHKPISTMTAIPLAPNYQGGANTIFTYPQSRRPQIGEKSSTKPFKNDRT